MPHIDRRRVGHGLACPVSGSAVSLKEQAQREFCSRCVKNASGGNLHADFMDQIVEGLFDCKIKLIQCAGAMEQMRRAAVSNPANIAEGFRRRGKADKARFLNIAEGSVEECRYFLILAKDLGYGDTQTLTTALEEVSRLLGAYTAAILTSGS